jgi:hypothetical protein
VKRALLFAWFLLYFATIVAAGAAKVYLPISSITQIDMEHAKCKDVSDTLAVCDRVMVTHLPKLSATPVKEDGRQIPLK